MEIQYYMRCIKYITTDHSRLNVLPEYKASPTLYVKGVLTLKEIPAAEINTSTHGIGMPISRLGCIFQLAMVSV